jgi:hypothetical protein
MELKDKPVRKPKQIVVIPLRQCDSRVRIWEVEDLVNCAFREGADATNLEKIFVAIIGLISH